MAKSTIFFILCVCVMAQFNQARPGPRGFVLWNMFEDGVRERIPMKNTIAQTSLVNEQMKEITRILKETVIASTDVFRKVVMEANESENQNTEFRTNLATLTLFTESVGRLLQAPEHAQLTWLLEDFEDLVHIMDKYNFNVMTHPSEEDKYFKRLLDQNDMPSVKRMFTLSCVAFVEGFDETVADYIASLTPEQKKFESEFITRFQTITGESNYDNLKWFETVLARLEVKLPKEKY